jgi:hypothetical protein
VTGRLARWALRLYPLAFQRRYGPEMRALLEQERPRPRAVLDLLRGALIAHLQPPAAAQGWADPADRVRASTSGVLLCWIVFAAAGFGYYKTTEDAPFSAAGDAHPLLRDAHLAVQAVALITSAAVVLGALPLIAAAVAHARREHRLRRVLGSPLSPLAAFAGLTVVAVLIAHAQSPHYTSAAGYAAAIVWWMAGLGCAAACAAACRAALFATPVTPARLRYALASGTLVTIGMLAIAIASTVYAVALILDASRLAGSANGPFQVLSTAASLIIQVIVMVAMSALAGTATRRGWRVSGELGDGMNEAPIGQ